MDRTLNEQKTENDVIRPGYGGYIDGMSQIPPSKWSVVVWAIRDVFKGWSPPYVAFIFTIAVLGYIARTFVKYGHQELRIPALIVVLTCCLLIFVLGLISLSKGSHSTHGKDKEKIRERKITTESGVKPNRIQPIEDTGTGNRSHVHDRRDSQGVGTL